MLRRRAELVVHAERYRRAQLEALTREAAENPDLPDALRLALLVATSAIARIIVLERAMGLTYGHAEAQALVEQLLQRFEGGSSPAFDETDCK